MLQSLVSAAGGKTAVFSSVLKGIGSVFSGRSKRKEARRQREHEERMAREQIAAEREFIGLRAGEDRRTQKEGALLEEWMRQNRRSEISRGAKNFTGFAGSEFKDYTPAASPVQRQVSPDEFINSGGIISQIAAAPAQGAAPATDPFVRLGDSNIFRSADGQFQVRP